MDNTTPSSYSLYIHIPFCSSFCRYCDFYSVKPDPHILTTFLDALCNEFFLFSKKYNLTDIPITTLFIGGGTPTVLSPMLFEKLNKNLISKLNRTNNFEWTIECNPESFSPDHAHCFADMGVTRLTFGIQSLIEKELSIIGRKHTPNVAINLFQSDLLKPFNSIGADIIFGLPTQTKETLSYTLTTLLSNPIIKHLSAYELDLHKSTSLFRHKNKLPFPSEDAIVDMYNLIGTLSQNYSFHRYEISNYAKPNHECTHNKVYWNHKPYLGLGPSAHSFFNNTRFANVSNVNTYINNSLHKKLSLDFSETITLEHLADEMILLALRTAQGINEEDFFKFSGIPFYSGKRIATLDMLCNDGFVIRNGGFARLTPVGMNVADSIIKKLA